MIHIIKFFTFDVLKSENFRLLFLILRILILLIRSLRIILIDFNFNRIRQIFINFKNILIVFNALRMSITMN
jgi:hypothetical protein